jgi:hypothetical protein
MTVISDFEIFYRKNSMKIFYSNEYVKVKHVLDVTHTRLALKGQYESIIKRSIPTGTA